MYCHTAGVNKPWEATEISFQTRSERKNDREEQSLAWVFSWISEKAVESRNGFFLGCCVCPSGSGSALCVLVTCLHPLGMLKNITLLLLRSGSNFKLLFKTFYFYLHVCICVCVWVVLMNAGSGGIQKRAADLMEFTGSL